MWWDDELTDTIKNKWLKRLCELKNINSFEILWCYPTNVDEIINIELHKCCDVSEKYMAAVEYLRLLRCFGKSLKKNMDFTY